MEHFCRGPHANKPMFVHAFPQGGTVMLFAITELYNNDVISINFYVLRNTPGENFPVEEPFEMGCQIMVPTCQYHLVF